MRVWEWLRRGNHLSLKQGGETLYALPTLIISHQEETHLRKPQTFHDALPLSLSRSLSSSLSLLMLIQAGSCLSLPYRWTVARCAVAWP